MVSWIWPNNQGAESCYHQSLSFLFVWYDGVSLVEALPCSTQESDQCHSQCCGRFWWQGNSSNASVSIRWGLAGASVWILGVSKTLCGLVWYQRMYWWCTAYNMSKVPAVTDHMSLHLPTLKWLRQLGQASLSLPAHALKSPSITRSSCCGNPLMQECICDSSWGCWTSGHSKVVIYLVCANLHQKIAVLATPILGLSGSRGGELPWLACNQLK